MSDPLKNLKAEIHKHDFTDDPGGEHAKFILEIFDKALISNEEQLRDRAPPLDMVIYALKSIIYPTFVPQLMSDFLDLFSMVEYYRMRVTDKADRAIAFNTYFQKSQSSGVPPLKEEDEVFFQHVIDDNEEMRKMFMHVVTTCCVMDLRRLWLNGSNTDFWLRWNEYLSVLRRPEDRIGSHRFQYKLSVNEISSLHDACVKFSNFMALTGQWMEDNQEPDQTISDIFETQAFGEQFPDLNFTPDVERLVDYHLNYVQEVVQRLVSNPVGGFSIRVVSN